MSRLRLITHPLLLNRRSRFIFFTCAIAVLFTSAVLWKNFFSFLHLSDIDLTAFPTEENPLLRILLSPITHIAIACICALVGGSLIAVHVVGPLKRLEEWLIDVEKGHETKPFKIRLGDEIYENVIDMMNNLYAKKTPRRSKSN